MLQAPLGSNALPGKTREFSFCDKLSVRVTTPASIPGCEAKRDKEAPGEEPDEVEAPVEVAGELVVVTRDAAAEEAEDVLVDEVEPEEAVAIHPPCVAQAGENVPRSGHGEEEDCAGKGLERAPVAIFAGECEIDDGGAEDEDQRDQSLGEDGEGERGPHRIGVERVASCRLQFASGTQGAQEAVKRDGEEEREQHVGDEDAREEEDSGGGEHTEARVEACTLAERLVGPAVAEQGQQQDCQGQRKVGGEGVEAEEAKAGGGDPVGQRRFFEVAHSVDAQGDPVSGEDHLAGGIGVGAVGVVQHGRREERREEKQQPEGAQQGEHAQVPGLLAGAGGDCGFRGGGKGHGNLAALTAYVAKGCGRVACRVRAHDWMRAAIVRSLYLDWCGVDYLPGDRPSVFQTTE